jgi:integrase
VVSFETEREASKYVDQARKVIDGLTLGDAVTEYLTARAAPSSAGRALRGSTLKLERWRLVAILRLTESDRPLSGLTRAVAKHLFDLRAAEVKPDTLVGELATVGRACRWWVAKGRLPSDPFEGCVVLGDRSAGKPQLRVDEARRFLDAALREGSPEGLACALALLTGMRASEVTGLVVRDIDDGGRIIWIEDNAVRRLKTARSRKRLEVPGVLVDLLVRQCEGKGPEDRLWGNVDRHWLGRNVPRLCKVSGVPKVSPHGLRGTWATLAVAAMPTEAVAATLRNLPEVSRTAYIAPGAEQSALGQRVMATVIPLPKPASDSDDTLN